MTPPRRVQRPGFIYWPLATPFLLAAGFIVIVVAAFLLVGVFSYAFARLGISPGTASLVLLAGLIGSAVNIPVARLSSRAVRVEPYISVFGLRYFVAVMRKRVTVSIPAKWPPGPSHGVVGRPRSLFVGFVGTGTAMAGLCRIQPSPVTPADASAASVRGD